MRFQHSSRRAAAGVLSGCGNKMSRWLVSFASPLGGTNSQEEPMGFVRAVSLRIGGFLVVLGGFLVFASMKAKVAKTESLPPPLPRRGALSCLARIRGFLPCVVCRSRRGWIVG